MIYTRKKIDYWRVHFYGLLYIHGSWYNPRGVEPKLTGCITGIYKDDLYLCDGQFFLQVL